MGIIKLVAPKDSWEQHQARLDESIVTGRPHVERPYYFEDTVTGRQYYGLFSCVGWPPEVRDKASSMSGYSAIVGIVKSRSGAKKAKDADFQLLAETESPDVPTLLDAMVEMREEYGFGLHPLHLQSLYGDAERYITTLALYNERLEEQRKKPLLVVPPVDCYAPDAKDQYIRSLSSCLIPGKLRFYFGSCNILKINLREFERDKPAVYAVGGLVHTLLHVCAWMDTTKETMFTVEEEEYAVA